MNAVISSRTPEGHSCRCPVCDSFVVVEPSDPGGDAPCPCCGHLLWLSPPRRRGDKGIVDAAGRLSSPGLGRRLGTLVAGARRVIRAARSAKRAKAASATPKAGASVWDPWLDGQG